MNTPPRPSLKSLTPTPDSPQDATPAVPPAAVGGPEVAAREGVPSALLPDPHPGHHPGDGITDPTPDRPGIRIYAPPVYRRPKDGARWSKRLGDTPTAAYACACGHSATATGLRAVTALVTAYDAHKTACTGTPTAQPDRRAAA
ncbi:hypothetical protein ABZX85_01850 [Streptomyces sp. NPDC004539]|uniref:hypothetical protein n=1 Tax=Streptomyces sp. NPDC004539 TaxID=3154280 RepID=UPI0033B4A6AA